MVRILAVFAVLVVFPGPCGASVDKLSSNALLPIVINTWPFTNATRAGEQKGSTWLSMFNRLTVSVNPPVPLPLPDFYLVVYLSHLDSGIMIKEGHTVAFLYVTDLDNII